MKTVKDMEFFFGKEFSAQELTNAIEDLNFYTDEIKHLYGLESSANVEKTFVLGTLAGNEIAERCEESRGVRISDEQMDEIYKLGMEVAEDKHPSFESLEPKLDRMFYNEKEFHPYSKDMRNLEKLLDTWAEQGIESRSGAFATGDLNSVWIDNWRIKSGKSASEIQLSNKIMADWEISYKGMPTVAGDYANYAEYVADDGFFEKAKLSVGDVLQTVEKKLGVTCPQIYPGKDSSEPRYKPTQDYYIDKMEFKERDFYRNPPYPGFAEQIERAKSMAEKSVKSVNSHFHIEGILPHSRHPDDADLFCVMAKNSASGKYAVWTSFDLSRGKNGSLENGHYDIKDLNAAAKIACSFSSTERLHAEHLVQNKQKKSIER